MKRRAGGAGRQRPAARRSGADALSAAVDGLGVAHAAGRGQHVSAAALAAATRRSRTTASCSRARAWAATSRTACLLAAAVTLVVAAVQRRGRLRVRQAALRRRDRIFKLLLGALVIPVAGRDGAAVPAAEAAGPGQHVRRRDRAGDGRASSASSSCGSTRCRFRTSCSRRRASTAPASCASSARSSCRC